MLLMHQWHTIYEYNLSLEALGLRDVQYRDTNSMIKDIDPPAMDSHHSFGTRSRGMLRLENYLILPIS